MDHKMHFLQLSGQVWWGVESSCAAKHNLSQLSFISDFQHIAILMTSRNWSCNLAG